MTITHDNSLLTVLGDPARDACWSCGDQLASHFCTHCGKVQPPKPVDYFTFFGLPQRLQIDPAKLERAFYELSRKLHPDVYAQATPQEREWSLEQSSRLNDAYRTLKDPIMRTEYALGLAGIELEEQSKSATEAARASGGMKKQIVPPDLLEEVFELNMQLEELRMNKKMGEDDPALLEEVKQKQSDLESKQDALSVELQQIWEDWDQAQEATSEAAIGCANAKMLDLLNRRNYIRNLVRDVNELLEA